MAKSVYKMARGFCTFLRPIPELPELQFRVPKGALYGKDEFGYFIITDKTTYTAFEPEVHRMDTRRWDSRINDWIIVCGEKSHTIDYIAEHITAEEQAFPIEYARLIGLRDMSRGDNLYDPAMSRNGVRRHKTKSLHAPTRHTHPDQIPLDVWESVAPMMWEEINGHHTINKRNMTNNRPIKAYKYVINRPYVKIIK